ncbi:response regulator [Desulfatitalea alkaliphila]|uniref:histidine kinase n=1 Tax=Desulfatitalea alkaliphila TaxID=2929485 RepID=A0AA41RA89_9BACT|nr:response regulator [Desulfatitalea alkaliphila]MCJ8501533.1 response regulator [Desulfatitalea alkaliphila]
MKILIVDDKEENRYLLEVLLKGQGHQVVVAADGEQALEHLQGEATDLIISDILMPVMDGFELCRRVRADKRLHTIPFIVYSATYTDSRDEDLALKIGANRFIVKPCEPDRFIETMHEVMVTAKPSPPTVAPSNQQEGVLKLYNERLVNKLEHKMLQLEKEVEGRRNAEAVLREREQHFRNLANSSRALIYTLNADYLAEYFNDPYLAFTGRPLEQERGEGWVASVHPEDQPHVKEVLRRSRARHDAYSLTYRLRRHDGEYRWFQDDGSPCYDSYGRFNGYIGHCLDITKTKQDQERYEHLNAVLKSIQDVNQLIIRERDIDALIRGACRLIVDNRGYAAAMIVLTGANDRPTTWARSGTEPGFTPMIEALEQGELPPCADHTATGKQCGPGPPSSDPACHVCPAPDTGKNALCLHLRLVDDGVSIGFLIAVAEKGVTVVDPEERQLLEEMAGDIAYAVRMLLMDRERRRIEEDHEKLRKQMIQTQRLESVGRLAGGVAHDFNNMLSVILGYAELAMEKAGNGTPLHDDLTEVFNAGRRSKEITRQLLAFARKQIIAPKVLDLNEILESMLKMLRRLIGEEVDIAWLPAAGLWPIRIDPSQVDQLLANLCVNARDAIGGVGKITIETENATIDETYCAVHQDAVPGDYVLLAVRDDGCGMDKELMDQIFEPFFTTKAVHQGSGLGLSTVYGIIRQNDGFVHVESEPGKGTIFHIYFPRHDRTGDAVRLAEKKQPPAGRGETILLVEDEKVLLKMGTTMLNRFGYKVLAADSPEAAIRLATHHDHAIDLLVTDVVMPGMNGRDLAEQLHAHNPGIKCLFISGYTADVIAKRGVLDEGVLFLQKPFSLHELASKVRMALNG